MQPYTRSIFEAKDYGRIKDFPQYKKEVQKAVKNAFIALKSDIENVEKAQRIKFSHFSLVKRLQDKINHEAPQDLNIVIKDSPNSIYQVVYRSGERTFYTDVMLPPQKLNLQSVEKVEDELNKLCKSTELQDYNTQDDIHVNVKARVDRSLSMKEAYIPYERLSKMPDDAIDAYLRDHGWEDTKIKTMDRKQKLRTCEEFITNPDTFFNAKYSHLGKTKESYKDFEHDISLMSDEDLDTYLYDHGWEDEQLAQMSRKEKLEVCKDFIAEDPDKSRLYFGESLKLCPKCEKDDENCECLQESYKSIYEDSNLAGALPNEKLPVYNKDLIQMSKDAEKSENPKSEISEEVEDSNKKDKDDDKIKPYVDDIRAGKPYNKVKVKESGKFAYLTSIFEESNKPFDIGDGFYITKRGLDNNGNFSIWVSKGSGRAKKIQTNGNLSVTHPDNDDFKDEKIQNEIKAYYKKYLMKEDFPYNLKPEDLKKKDDDDETSNADDKIEESEENLTAPKFCEKLTSIIEPLFPNSSLKVKFENNLSPSVTMWFALRKKWINNIIHNDPFYAIFHFYGFNANGSSTGKTQVEGSMAEAITVKSAPESKLAFERLKTGWRRKTGTQAQVLRHVELFFTHLKQLVLENSEKLSDVQKENYVPYLKSIYEQKSEAGGDYEIINDKKLDSIKDNFTPPKIEDEEEV